MRVVVVWGKIVTLYFVVAVENLRTPQPHPHPCDASKCFVPEDAVIESIAVDKVLILREVVASQPSLLENNNDAEDADEDTNRRSGNAKCLLIACIVIAHEISIEYILSVHYGVSMAYRYTDCLSQ